jgi:predicted Zn-dependent protease
LSAPERPLGERGTELVRRLTRTRGLEVEAFEKRGRSRRFERSPTGEWVANTHERGWAVRAGDLRRSWFASGTGELPAEGPWPEASAHPLWLPQAATATERVAPPPGLEAPLASESEARALVEGVERELARELPGARLPAALLEDGASESVLISSRGASGQGIARVARLRLEAERGESRVVSESWERSGAELKPVALARRIADRILALEGAVRPPAGARLLAAPVVARLLEAYAPALVGREAAGRLRAGEPVGDPRVRIVDDGSLAGGLLWSASDGEGVACRELTLVEAGRFARPLLAWWESDRPQETSGCARRASYRDLPRRAPTHFYLDPDPTTPVADLLADVVEGTYLIDVEGGVRIDESTGGFSVAVSGFALARGRTAGGLGRATLTGSFGALFGGVRGLGRDLQFVAGDGMFGAPSLLVDGLDLAGAP